MDGGRAGLDALTWSRFARAVGAFATCEVRHRARLLFTSLLVLLLAINALNVVNSYVGRDFTTAIEQRDITGFVSKALLYAAVFAASTLVAVLARFCEERLGLLWREWQTRELLSRYLDRGRYYRLKDSGTIDNPDQRIAEDVRTFTTTTLSFVLMILNATITIVAFSGVMWSISPVLFGVAVAYAGVGTALTVLLGRPLIGLNYRQFDREAAFRAELVHVRENAESIAFAHREGGLQHRLLDRLGGLVENARRIIAVNRNLSFFTTGYNYGIQLVPALIVGPLFIRGEAEFGVITQSAMAFSHLLGAFSLVVTQFQSISSYAAALTRLSHLADATGPESGLGSSAIEIVEAGDRLAYERVTLRSRLDGRVLLRDFTASVPRAGKLLVTGPNEGARVALFRATAGLWDAGEGRVLRPAGNDLMLLSERPYLPAGTLREVLMRGGDGETLSDERVHGVMDALELEPMLARTGGLDAERDWDDLLSLPEHQLLAVARLLLAAPRFAVLHGIGLTLGPEHLARVLEVLCDASIGVLHLTEADDAAAAYDGVIEVAGDGGWRWKRGGPSEEPAR
jgi:putative ATP-binding cassette transporter